MASDWIYLFLRTKIALKFADDEISSAFGDLGEIEVDGMPVGDIDFGDNAAWEDALAVRIPSVFEFPRLVRYFDDHLQNMEAWALHDTEADSFERPATAMLDMFFRENSGKRKCQIYLRYNPDSVSEKKSVDNLRSELDRKVGCRQVFYFRNGIILLTASNEPPKVTLGRCQRFVRGLSGFLFVEPNGDTFSVTGSADKRVERFF